MPTPIDNSGAEYREGEHYVHCITYHLVWCSKRRKPVLQGLIAEECEALLRKRCAQKDWRIRRLAVASDHVSLRVQVLPTDAAVAVAKDLKDFTAHVLRPRHVLLTKLPSLWTRAVFTSTACHIDQARIDAFVAAQKRT